MARESVFKPGKKIESQEEKARMFFRQFAHKAEGGQANDPYLSGFSDPSMRMSSPTLGDLLSDLWKARLHIFIGVALSGLACLCFLFMSTPYHQARMMVGPASPLNAPPPSISSDNANMSMLAGFVQRMGGAGSGAEFIRFEHMFAGPRVARNLLRDPAVLRGLALDRAFGAVAEGTPDTEGWTPEMLSEYLEERVRLESVGTTQSLRRLVYMHPNPEFAVYLLTRIHSITDGIIRETIQQETTGRISYLNDAIESTRNPEHRRALTSLLLEQERLRMLVSIDQPYAAVMIEPATASYSAVWPDPVLFMIGFVFAGALAGFLVYSFRKHG